MDAISAGTWTTLQKATTPDFFEHDTIVELRLGYAGTYLPDYVQCTLHCDCVWTGYYQADFDCAAVTIDGQTIRRSNVNPLWVLLNAAIQADHEKIAKAIVEEATS